MPISALLELTIKPESLADAPTVIHQTLQATRAFEGCLGVDVLMDTDDPTHIVLLEQWDSLESDAAYRAWRSTPDGASDLRTILAGPPRLTRFTTASEV